MQTNEHLNQDSRLYSCFSAFHLLVQRSSIHTPKPLGINKAGCVGFVVRFASALLPSLLVGEFSAVWIRPDFVVSITIVSFHLDRHLHHHISILFDNCILILSVFDTSRSTVAGASPHWCRMRQNQMRCAEVYYRCVRSIGRLVCLSFCVWTWMYIRTRGSLMVVPFHHGKVIKVSVIRLFHIKCTRW